jgi:hypothetical protein
MKYWRRNTIILTAVALFCICGAIMTAGRAQTTFTAMSVIIGFAAFFGIAMSPFMGVEADGD